MFLHRHASIVLVLFLLLPLVHLRGEEYTPSDETLGRAKKCKVLAAIAHHFNVDRLQYLSSVFSGLAAFPDIDIVVTTNTFDVGEIEQIRLAFDQATQEVASVPHLEILSYGNLSHPFYLTWCHKEIMNSEFANKESSYTHFIYLEDDMKLDFLNFCYFIEFRETLRPFGLLPAFLRVEYSKNQGAFVNSDNRTKINLKQKSALQIQELLFINPTNPYNAGFVMDRELIHEYLSSRSFDRLKSKSVSNWDIRERAAMGLTFEKIPLGFHSRYVVPLSLESGKCLRCAWIFHLPNNYADNPKTSFGKIPMDELFYRP